MGRGMNSVLVTQCLPVPFHLTGGARNRKEGLGSSGQMPLAVPSDSQAALGEERVSQAPLSWVGLDLSVDSSTHSSGEPRADGVARLAAILEGQEVAGEGQAPKSLSQSLPAPLALVLSV